MTHTHCTANSTRKLERMEKKKKKKERITASKSLRGYSKILSSSRD